MLDQDTAQVKEACQRFVEDMQRRRTAMDMTTKALANRMKFDPSYVSHVERYRHRPTRSFAFRADQALNAKGELFQLFEQYEGLRESRSPAPLIVRPADRPFLINERERTEQYFNGDHYVIAVERALYNGTDEPIVQYPMKIAVDEHATEPLSWDDVELSATCRDDPMDIQPLIDRPEHKEALLRFRNASYHFPLQPGQRATIRYSYRVPASTWGQWFQRAISCYTDDLVVKLVFPNRFAPQVWGREVSSEGKPPLTLTQEHDQETTTHVFRTSVPTLGTRFRFEWEWRQGHAPVPHLIAPEQFGHPVS